MSVVAVRVTEDGYEIAADSITVRGWTQTKGENTKHSKLIEVNGIVIGSVGRCDEASLFQLYANTHKPAAPTEAAMLEYLSEFSEWKNKKANKNEIENSYIIGFDRAAFAIEGWFVERISTFEAIGAGQDFALAVLHMGGSVEDAVRTACELSVMCEAPVQVVRKMAEVA